MVPGGVKVMRCCILQRLLLLHSHRTKSWSRLTWNLRSQQLPTRSEVVLNVERSKSLCFRIFYPQAGTGQKTSRLWLQMPPSRFRMLNGLSRLHSDCILECSALSTIAFACVRTPQNPTRKSQRRQRAMFAAMVEAVSFEHRCKSHILTEH